MRRFGAFEMAKTIGLALIGAAALGAMMLAALPSPAHPAEIYAGPYAAEVTRVVDADTVEVRVALWPGQTVEVAVRIDGIDTPESWRPKCPAERAMARKAKAFVEARVSPGDSLLLTDVKNGKYAGRVVGTLSRTSRAGPRPIATELIAEGLAVSYDGGTKRDWCAVASTGG